MVGLWRLLSREDHDAAGRRRIDPLLGADPAGLLAFSETRFSAQFMRRDRTSAGEPAAPQAAGANNPVASGGYDATFGSYTPDEARGLLTVHLEGSIQPANIGLSFARDLRVDGGRLRIRLVTTTPDGTPITRLLTFERA